MTIASLTPAGVVAACLGFMPFSVRADSVLTASEFAPSGMVGSVVGLAVDAHGRVLVTQTNRRTHGALDIRKYRSWIPRTLASQSIEDKRALIREEFHQGIVGDANEDGAVDWRDLLVPSELVILLEDTDGDGKADRKQTFAGGFNTEITGLAGGVMAHDGSVYTTIIPDLWRLDDLDGDGTADERTSIAHGFGLHVGYGGHDMHGLTIGPDGKIYWSIGDKAFSVTSKEGRHFHYPYHGAIFRCDSDGSNFEVVAKGLRNPQEPAFDEFGNLFVVDNDGDFGDREGFRYVLEGSDGGWRATHQYRGKEGYNAWMAEDLWRPAFHGQAAYITPCIANFSEGPAGFAYNPGTALSEAFRGHFFLAEFPGKRLQAFRAIPDGAGFKMSQPSVVLEGQMLVGINFGPDGALYGADWGDNEWVPHQNGRVLKIDVREPDRQRLRSETKILLGEGMRHRPEGQLLDLLGHQDQRVRLAAQFEIVNRGDFTILRNTAVADSRDLARVHAIWACAQLVRMHTGESMQGLMPVMQHANSEIRAQMVKALGDTKSGFAKERVVDMLGDRNPRVRLFAAMALHHLAGPKELKAITRFIAANAEDDVFLRHAGVRALTGAARDWPELLADLHRHPSQAVRLAGVVASRRLHEAAEETKSLTDSDDYAAVTVYLNDLDDLVVTETARAIHDVNHPSTKAMERLAGLLGRRHLTSTAVVVRSINANRWLGGEVSALRLMVFAASDRVSDAHRLRAIKSLSTWLEDQPLDPVLGTARATSAFAVADAHRALDQHLGRLLGNANEELQQAATRMIQTLKYQGAEKRLIALFKDATQPPANRASALEALASLGASESIALIQEAKTHSSPELRRIAQSLITDLSPQHPQTIAMLKEATHSTDLGEQQQAYQLLGKLKAAEALREPATLLIDGKVDQAIQLDIIEAVTAAGNAELIKLLESYTQIVASEDPLAPYRWSLSGGDAREGMSVFMTSIAAQCLRCHQLNGTGGEIGPDLTEVASRLSPEQLLRSLVTPQVEISEGYGLVTLTMTNGDLTTGILVRSDENQIVIKDLDGMIHSFASDQIANQTKPVSSMPPMGAILSKRELRDLMAYLVSLKSKAIAP